MSRWRRRARPKQTTETSISIEYAERTLLSHGPVPPRWSDGFRQPSASDHVGPLSLRPSRTRREITRNGPGRSIAQWRVGVVGEPERARRFFREATGVRPAGFVHPAAARCEIGQRPLMPSAFRCAETRPASRTGPAGDPAELSVQPFQRAATERAGPSRRSRRRPGANRPARIRHPTETTGRNRRRRASRPTTATCESGACAARSARFRPSLLRSRSDLAKANFIAMISTAEICL